MKPAGPPSLRPPSLSSLTQPQQQPPRPLPQPPAMPAEQCFVCNTCNVYIASILDFLPMDDITASLYFQKAENVKLARRNPRTRNRGIVVAQVKCVNCNSFLGQKYVRVDYPSQVIHNGIFKFHWIKLLYWNGYKVTISLPPYSPSTSSSLSLPSSSSSSES